MRKIYAAPEPAVGVKIFRAILPPFKDHAGRKYEAVVIKSLPSGRIQCLQEDETTFQSGQSRWET